MKATSSLNPIKMPCRGLRRIIIIPEAEADEIIESVKDAPEDWQKTAFS